MFFSADATAFASSGRSQRNLRRCATCAEAPIHDPDTRLEFEVRTAVAADALPAGPFNCVVADLLTVGVYSLAGASAWLARLTGRYPDVPVIVVTGHPSAMRDAAALGAHRVLMKPSDVDGLIAAVRESITS